jgi:hypothetical protein
MPSAVAAARSLPAIDSAPPDVQPVSGARVRSPTGPHIPHAGAGQARRLGSYIAAGGVREIVSLMCADASTLILDRVAETGSDPRMVAVLRRDEPPGNPRLICALYLADETRGRCRALTAEDLEHPLSEGQPPGPEHNVGSQRSLLDGCGRIYALRELALRTGLAELRWTRARAARPLAAFETLTLRAVLGALQAYEPARSITVRMLAARGDDRALCTRCLSDELTRLQRSPLVLNRGLREAVERRVAIGISMSEIARRCGRVKHQRGHTSGETSWLARRIGQMPEGAHAKPTPWIHSDTLALIARQGLGISPNEVEL